MGMTEQQYWEGSPYLVYSYKKAFKIKRKLENEMAWIQGMYIFDAVIVSLQNVLRKRGQKREMYIDKPFDIFPLTKYEKQQRELEEIQKMQKTFQAMRSAQIARKKKKELKSKK